MLTKAQESYPQLHEIDTLTMRTRAILLVKDVILFMTLCTSKGELFN